jgi:hypothetical protein
MKNFWNYLTNSERFFLFASICLIFLAFKNDKNAVLYSMLLAFSINYIVSVYHSFEKDKNILIERRGYLFYIMNLYYNSATGGIKKILESNIIRDKETDALSYKASISNMDASLLKEYLLLIKEHSENLLNNKSISWKEKRCLYVLINRINEFIGNNPQIIIYKDGMFGIVNVEIDVKWLYDIQYCFDNKIVNFIDTTIIEMFNKYKFSEKLYK